MKTVKGDIVALAKAGEFDVVVHGCNCFHTMGAGVALQLATEFAGIAGVAETDRAMSLYGDAEKLGTYTLAVVNTDDGNPFVVVNAYTQFGTANADNTSPVDYDAIRSAFRALALLLVNQSRSRIGYPAIGAGLAGGDWEIISKIIDEELVGFDHTYVEYVPATKKVYPRVLVIGQQPLKGIAQRLRDACGADIWCDTSVGWVSQSADNEDDDWMIDVDSQIDDAIAAMSEAADLLDPQP